MKNLNQIDGLMAKKDTLANLTALARVEGVKYYATDTKKYYTDSGTTLVEEGSGSGAGGDGSIYLNLDADNDLTSNWTNTGTGGFVIDPTNPISGTKSYIFTPTATGDELSYQTNIPLRSRGKFNSSKIPLYSRPSWNGSIRF